MPSQRVVSWKPLGKYAVLTFASLILAVIGVAAAKKNIPRGASIFIEEMSEDLDGFIRAEIVAKNLPLTIVLKREEAHLVMTGTSTGNEKRSWHEGWLTAEKDHAVGNVMVFDRTNKSMLWAGEAGDRSLWWGGLARGGQRKVASRLVDKLKDAITPKAQPLSPPPPLSPEEIASTNPSDAVTGNPNAESKVTSAKLMNGEIVRLVKAGLGSDVIVAKITISECAFDLSADALIALKQAGVPEAVIASMIQASKK